MTTHCISPPNPTLPRPFWRADLYEAVKALIEAIPLPSGYTFKWKGEANSSAKANRDLGP
ncbi:MAG: hypothetical protein GDA36_06925 [Rhodobacteraceae bacterium]|nr:hypothetical protein [Paracoccaceae bacterium]